MVFGFQTDNIHVPGNVLPLTVLDLYLPENSTRQASPQHQVEGSTLAETILADRVAMVAHAREGVRHNTLVSNLLPVAGLVKGNALDYRALDQMIRAAKSTGLPKREIDQIRSWVWDKATAWSIATRSVNALHRPAGASDAARKRSLQHGDNALFYYDRLILAGFKTGDSVASYREVNKQLRGHNQKGIGYQQHQRLLQHALFEGGYMPSFDTIQAYYEVQSTWVTKLNPDDMSTLPNYRQAIEVTYHNELENGANQQSSPSQKEQARVFGCSRRTIQRDTLALHNSNLVRRRHRAATYEGVIESAGSLSDTSGCWFLMTDNGETYPATKDGYARGSATGSPIMLFKHRTIEYWVTSQAKRRWILRTDFCNNVSRLSSKPIRIEGGGLGDATPIHSRR